MPTAWIGRDAIQAQAAYLIGAPRLRILLRCGLASPRLAVRSPPSSHILPAQTDDSRDLSASPPFPNP